MLHMLSPTTRSYENHSNTKLEAALDKASKKAIQYEYQIRDLEVSRTVASGFGD